MSVIRFIPINTPTSFSFAFIGNPFKNTLIKPLLHGKKALNFRHSLSIKMVSLRLQEKHITYRAVNSIRLLTRFLKLCYLLNFVVIIIYYYGKKSDLKYRTIYAQHNIRFFETD